LFGFSGNLQKIQNISLSPQCAEYIRLMYSASRIMNYQDYRYLLIMADFTYDLITIVCDNKIRSLNKRQEEI